MMDARKVIFSFAVLAIFTVTARPQGPQSVPGSDQGVEYSGGPGQVYAPQPQYEQPQQPQYEQPQYQPQQPQFQGDQPQGYQPQPEYQSAPQQPQQAYYDNQPGRQERQISSRSKRYIPYGSYSTVHTYSYLTPYPNSIRSIQYAPPVYAAAAYHAPVQPLYY